MYHFISVKFVSISKQEKKAGIQKFADLFRKAESLIREKFHITISSTPYCTENTEE